MVKQGTGWYLTIHGRVLSLRNRATNVLSGKLGKAKHYIPYIWVAFLSVTFTHTLKATELHAMDSQSLDMGMYVLGAWGMGNVVISGAFMIQDNKDKYFHQMNVGWGGINAAIAGFSFFLEPPAPSKLQAILAFNSGLDLAYVATGFYLKALADTKSSEKEARRLRGFGSSIIMQGSFLFVFDVFLWTILDFKPVNLSWSPLLHEEGYGFLLTYTL